MPTQRLFQEIDLRPRVKDIAQIQMGFQIRRQEDNGADGRYPIIQIKDIGEDNRVDLENLDTVATKGPVERYRVNRGDVLFQTRGRRFAAIPIVDDLHDTLATYVFFIIQPDPDMIRSEYLAWYINQAPAQTYLEKTAVGTVHRMVKKKGLEELEVDLPPLKTQETIVRLENLRQQEEATMKRIADLRKSLLQGICLRAARQTDNRKGASTL